MHETTRRALCRLGFVLLCAAPTLALGGYALWSPLTASEAQARKAWETALGRRVGLEVVVDRLETPRATLTKLWNVALRDPETHVLLATVDALEIHETDQGWALVGARAELHAAQWERLGEALDRHAREGDDPRPLTLSLNALRLAPRPAGGEPAPRGHSLAEIEARFEKTGGASRWTARFRLPDETTSDPAEFRLARAVRDGAVVRSWRLHTGGRPLPCALLAEWLPALRCLGESSGFHGLLSADETPGGWSWHAAGRLHAVDTHRLLADFPHAAQGPAEIELQEFVVEAGKVARASGVARAGPGQISHSLLEAADQWLPCGLDNRARDNPQTQWAYEELAFGFSVDQQGLRLAGKAGGVGVVARDSAGPLLWDRPGRTAPLVHLVRALAPGSDIQVPAAAEAAPLLEHLPLPPLKNPKPRQATLKIHRETDREKHR